MKAGLKRAVLEVVDGHHVHAPLEKVVDKVPVRLRNAPIEGFAHTLWELLEHIRLAQADILEYIVNPNYEAGIFPDDYWPKPDACMNWDKTVREYLADREQIKILLEQIDFLEPIPFGESNHTYLREVLVLVSHCSYHLGQMVTILRHQGVW